MAATRKPKREHIDQGIEAQVLLESCRRCCLCFGLAGDFDEKKGQLAHIDQDRAHNAERNLAFLCLPHHDQYDSQTRQSKNITRLELKTYKARLCQVVTQWRGAQLPFDQAAPPTASQPKPAGKEFQSMRPVNAVKAVRALRAGEKNK